MSRPPGLWRNPAFFRLWGASTTSVFGTMMTGLAVPWIAIDTLGASDRAVAALATVTLLPGVLFALVAGSSVDRLARRPILIASDLARAGLLLCVPLAFGLGVLSMPVLGTLVFATRGLSVLFGIAEHSFLLSVVERDDLLEANAKLTGGAAVAEGAAFGAAGWLAMWVTAPFVLAFDAATYVVSALFLRGIDVTERAVDRTAGSRWDDVRVAWAELLRAPELAAIARAEVLRGAAYGVFMTCWMLWVLRDLGFGIGVIGTIAATGALGSGVGSWLAPRLRTTFGLGPAMAGCLALASVSYLLIPLAPDAGWIGAAFLIGHQLLGDTFETAWMIQETSARQLIARSELLGRVNGGIGTLASGATLASALACTVLIDVLGARTLLFATPVLGAAAAWTVARALRTFR